MTLELSCLNTPDMTETDIPTQVFRLINKIIFLEKKNIFEFEGVKLFPSEIHLMMMVAETDSTNATRMAERLGISKSAVSQTVSRLEKKQILRKDKDPYNKNEMTLVFTGFGEKAMAGYREKQMTAMAGPREELARLSEHDRAVIRHFLSSLETMFDRLRQ